MLPNSRASEYWCFLTAILVDGRDIDGKEERKGKGRLQKFLSAQNVNWEEF